MWATAALVPAPGGPASRGRLEMPHPKTLQRVDTIISPLHSAVFPRKPPGNTAGHKIAIKMVKIKTGQSKDVTLTRHSTADGTTQRLSPFPSEIQNEGEPSKKEGGPTPAKDLDSSPHRQQKPKEGANPLSGGQSRTEKED